MSVEYSTIVIPLDEKQQEILDRKAQEGWEPIPGVPPMGIWVVQRVVQYMMEGKGIGRMHIDDSKIFILRNGKLIDKDGNEVSREAAEAVGVTLP